MSDLQEKLFLAAIADFDSVTVPCKSCRVKTHQVNTKPAYSGGFICLECIDSYFMRTCPECDFVLETADILSKGTCPNCGESL